VTWRIPNHRANRWFSATRAASFVQDTLSFIYSYALQRYRVLLDADLAEIYDVTTGVLDQAVKRNAGRFHEDFMFRLTKEEKTELAAQATTVFSG